MKVLMQSRKNFFDLRGGDTVQLEKTKAELEKLGVEVDFSLEFEPDLSKYDLVHLSNVTRIQETYLHVLNAKRQGKPIALSTIYWPMEEFEKNGQIGLRKFINSHLSIDREEKIKAFARYIKDKNSRNISTKNLWKIGYTNMQKYVVNNVDYFLPNSEMEMDAFCESFEIKKANYKVIPNAIDANIAKIQEDADHFGVCSVYIGGVSSERKWKSDCLLSYAHNAVQGSVQQTGERPRGTACSGDRRSEQAYTREMDLYPGGNDLALCRYIRADRGQQDGSEQDQRGGFCPVQQCKEFLHGFPRRQL